MTSSARASFYERRQRRLLGAQARLQERRRRLRQRAALFAATFVAGVAVGVAATALGVFFLSAPVASDASPPASGASAQDAVKPPAPARAPAAPARDSRHAAAAAAAASDPRQPAPVHRPPQPAAAASPPASARADVPPASAPLTLPPRESVLDLTTSVHDWVEAAKRRDLSTQIALYADRIDSFYGRRDLSREDVRVAKLRAFGSDLLVDTGPLEIRLEPGGRAATVRFSKRYVVNGGGPAGQREVEQQLRWERTDAGWRIVDENHAPASARLRGS